MEIAAQTRMHKDQRYGWKAETSAPVKVEALPDDKERVLSITTMKRHDGYLRTTAIVSKVDGMFMSHTMFQDFSQTIENESTRVTQKAVEAQHQRAVNKLPEIIEAVQGWYKQKATNA